MLIHRLHYSLQVMSVTLLHDKCYILPFSLLHEYSIVIFSQEFSEKQIIYSLYALVPYINLTPYFNPPTHKYNKKKLIQFKHENKLQNSQYVYMRNISKFQQKCISIGT